MKLNDFAKGLTRNGIIVLNVSEGEITDYIVSEAATRTLIFRNELGVSSHCLDEGVCIVSDPVTINILRMLKGIK